MLHRDTNAFLSQAYRYVGVSILSPHVRSLTYMNPSPADTPHHTTAHPQMGKNWWNYV
jgi:hypothetical protein